MATIPEWLLLHTVVIRRYLGAGATGARFGPDEVTSCFAEDARRLIRNDDGQEVVSETTFYCLPTVATIPPESEVDVNGRTTTVIVARRRDGGGLPTPDHMEVSLK